ncbi:MAG: Clp protease ClpP [Candidatus Adlerbacteria bacterium]|nr:Clp protease ClpP [Candidatus Adlerbacteria bacterium]
MEITVGSTHVSVSTFLVLIAALIILFLGLKGWRWIKWGYGKFTRRSEKIRAKLVREQHALGLNIDRRAFTWVSKINEPNTVIVVRISGVIGDKFSPWAAVLQDIATFGEDVEEILARAANNDCIKGALLIFQTPGGTVSGSEMVRRAVAKFGGTKPVVAFINGRSTSGGVYSMVAAHFIIARHNSQLGHIGVRLPTVFHYSNVSELADLGGSRVRAGKIIVHPLFAGKGKLLGNPFIEPDEAVLKKRQEHLEALRERFVDYIVTHRRDHIDQDWLNSVGAEIFSEDEALEHKLVDRIGSQKDAEFEVARRITVPADQCNFALVQRGTRWGRMLSAAANLALPEQATHPAALRTEMAAASALFLSPEFLH